MKYIKNYEGLFDIFKRTPKDPKRKEVDDICKSLGLANYTINDDYSVDVDDTVNLSAKVINGKTMSEIPIKFNRVTGNFLCDHNLLRNLKNSPNWVGGRFDCRNQYGVLRTLEGAPSYVGHVFNCSENSKLKTLEFSPEVVESIDFSYTNVYTFEYISDKVTKINCLRTPIEWLYDVLYHNDDKSTIELFNAYDPIRFENDRPTIYKDRLEDLMDYVCDEDDTRKLYSFDIKNLKKIYAIK